MRALPHTGWNKNKREDTQMTIAEVSKKYDLSADTLRYYERIGLIPPVTRTAGGIPDYTEEDCLWVEFAKCMRGAGLSVEAFIEYVALFQKGEDTTSERKQILLEQRDLLKERIQSMQATLDRLNRKIEHYEQAVLPAEQKLIEGTAAHLHAKEPLCTLDTAI